MNDPLQIWTIYERPADYPSVPYVVRGWVIDGPEPRSNGALGFADTLEQARGYLPVGLVCVGRQDDDEPHIVESWL